MNSVSDIIVGSGVIDKVVKRLSSYVKPEDLQDITQDLYLEVLSMPEEKTAQLSEQGEKALLSYIASVCIYTVTNPDSKIMRKYGYDLGRKGVNIISIEDLTRREVSDEE